MSLICEALGVHRSSYHYWFFHNKTICPMTVETIAVVKQLFNRSKGAAGARTISTMATAKGYRLSRYRARKLMKKLNLVSRQSRKHRYVLSREILPALPNYLNREFNVMAPNQVWCGDVTYIWVDNRWLYLAVVMALFSRKPVGFALSHSPDTNVTLAALTMAFESRGRPQGLLFHSDQGCHYTSQRYRQQLADYQIKQSMSRRGNCWDNSPLARFFRSLKSEWIPIDGYSSFEEAKRAITDYIINDYCLIRPHSYHQGKTPNEAEKNY